MQLRDEVSKVAKVAQYFGPLGLQQPFGASGVSALANLGDIAQTIKDQVFKDVVPLDNTTSSVLTGLSYLAQVKPSSACAGPDRCLAWLPAA